MIDKFIITFLISSLIFGFTDTSKNRRHVNIANVICEKTDITFYRKYGLTLFGSGGSFVYNVKEISRTYLYPEEVDIDQARVMIIDCAQELFNAVNQNIEIRPLLDKYPFTSYDIKLSIICSNPQTDECYPPPSIAHVSVSNGYAKYHTSPHPDFPYKLVKKETFEEAIQLSKENFEQ